MFFKIENTLYSYDEVNIILLLSSYDCVIRVPLSMRLLRSVCQSKGVNYDALVAAEYHNIIENTEPFECAICFTDIECGCGIVLRDCLHMFCRFATNYFRHM